jgi:hypothetical protein
MKISKGMVVSILFISILILIGMLFWPFILKEIIAPTALVFWLLLRIFVLSIDQQYYWVAIIILTLIFLYRLLPQDSNIDPADEFTHANETLETIGYWRSLFSLIDINTQDENTLKRELIRLVISLYASKQRTSPNFLFYEALQRGEISLPDHIHTFLFPAEPEKSSRFAQKLLQSIRETPRKWIRRWNGQEIAEYNRMIDEILSFVETSLEIENDDGKFTPNGN